MAATKFKPYLLKLFLSNQYAYAQIVRKPDGHIVAAASTIEKELRAALASKTDTAACETIGKLLAQRAVAAGVPEVHWDRKHGQQFHGRTKALIQSMQAHGVGLN